MSEADAFKQLIQEQGLSSTTSNTAHFENQSRNTYENAIYSKKIMDTIYEQSPDQQSKPWLLVTSASHMYRSTKIFEKQGIPIIAVPVKMLQLTVVRYLLNQRLSVSRRG